MGSDFKKENNKTVVLIGCEPTGHYWFAFAKYVNDHQKSLVMVNPFSVKKVKEIDDNSPKKTDSKDPKTIAKLVVDGRYSIPYMPEGIYAEIRDLVYSRDRILKQHNISANRIPRWLAIHFPEYLGLYTRFDAASGLAVLEKAPLPKDIIALGINGIRKIWHDKIRGYVAEELQKIGQRPWLKLHITVLVLTEALEQKANYICCLESIGCGLRN